jgi:hypothetical protein
VPKTFIGPGSGVVVLGAECDDDEGLEVLVALVLDAPCPPAEDRLLVLVADGFLVSVTTLFGVSVGVTAVGVDAT